MNQRILFLAVAAAFASCATNPAAAQQRDRCSDYANGMVSQDQRARQAKCPGWTGHSNYNGHYSWCQKQTPQRVQQAIANWQTRFQSCQFAAGGSPAARADAVRCNSYGDDMVRMDRDARASRCTGWKGHSDRAKHIQWCQMQSTQKVDQALMNWSKRYAACR